MVEGKRNPTRLKLATEPPKLFQCSQSCDPGVKYRTVTCHRVIAGEFVDPSPLPDLFYNKRHHKDFCDVYNKPPSTAACLVRNCDDVYSWSPGPWGEVRVLSLLLTPSTFRLTALATLPYANQPLRTVSY